MKTQKFPSDQELEEMRELLSQGLASRPLAKDASNVDRLKHELCERFILYRQKNNLSQKELADRIGLDPALMSKILHCHYDEFTVDRLVRYLETLQKGVRLSLKVAS